MIQRKQTIFLLVAFVAVMICMCSQVGTLVSGMQEASLYNLWLTDGQGNHQFTVWPLFATLLIAALLSLVTIFMYAKRRLQSKMCLGLMLLLVLWYILLVVLPQQAGGELVLRWPAAMPAIAVVCAFFARKGVIADERLVRSLDRIR